MARLIKNGSMNPLGLELPIGMIPDPAAIFGAAKSLYDAVRLVYGKISNSDISDDYNGGDEFMRQCMRVATLFEEWACKNVNFEELDECWPYLLEDRFGHVVVRDFDHLLQSFNESTCLVIALSLKLPIKGKGGTHGKA